MDKKRDLSLLKNSQLVIWYLDISKYCKDELQRCLQMSEAHKDKNHYISAPQEMMSAECVCKDELTVRKHNL